MATVSKYKALFDSNGERITTYVLGVHFTVSVDAKGNSIISPVLPDGVIDISEADQSLYATGLYVRNMTNGHPRLRTEVETIDDVYKSKLEELDEACAKQYVSGFYSNASGTNLYYDSDEETQTLLSNILNRSKEDDWATLVRYPGVAPAGYAPVRARPNETSTNDEKVVNLLDASQLKKLLDDMDLAFWNTKSKLWSKQLEAKTFYENNDITGLKGVVW